MMSSALTTAVSAALGVLIMGGAWLAITGGLAIHPPPPPRRRRRRRMSRASWLALGAGLSLSVIATALTGWLAWLVIVPVTVVAVPRLLATGADPEVALLAALDRWIRTVTATLATGRSVSDALRVSARTSPDVLVDPLAHLLRRLDDRWSPREALTAMADEIDSSHADAVLAALILATERGGTGITASMHELSDAVLRRLAALRDIAAERAKPRIVIRQVSVVMGLMIVVSLIFGGQFFEPYGTFLGQVILVALVMAYLGSLAMLRRMAGSRRRARILEVAR